MPDTASVAGSSVTRHDHLDSEARSALMRMVRRTGTGAEMIVRSVAHRMGHRFRVNRADLPGRPDIVFSVGAHYDLQIMRLTVI